MLKLASFTALALAAAPVSAATIAPVSVTASSTFNNGFYKAENLIDGSGLGADGLHDSQFQTMWQSDLDVNQATLTFAFDQVFSLDRVSIWNYNWGNPAEFQSTILRGVKDFRLLTSLDGATYTQRIEARLAMGTGQPLAAQLFDGGQALARFVRIEILNNYGEGTYAERDWNSGLAEVRFAAVPEPASWALMIGGFGLAGGALRRRSARVVFA